MLFRDVWDSHFYPTASLLALLGLESARDCLTHLEVPEGYTKRGPDKKGLVETPWGILLKRHNGLLVVVPAQM